MPLYRVIWEIDLYGYDHKDAAEIAMAMQRYEPGNMATVFTIKEHTEDGLGPETKIDLEPSI